MTAIPDNRKIRKEQLIGVVKSIQAGTNVTVDDADPENPIVSASGGGSFTYDLLTGISLEDLGGGATYTVSSAGVWLHQTDSMRWSILAVDIQGINTVGTPTGNLRINFDTIGGINAPSWGTIEGFTGSDTMDISERVPYVGFDSADGIRFPKRDDYADILSGVTFTSGRIVLSIFL